MYGDEEAHKLFSASMNVDDVPIKLEPLDDTEPADNGANKSEGVETKTKDNSVNEDVKEEEEEEIEEEEDEVELDVSEILNVSMNPSDDEQEEQEKVKEEENESGTEDMEEKEVKIENETEGSEDEDSGDRPGEEGEEVTQKEAEYRPWTWCSLPKADHQQAWTWWGHLYRGRLTEPWDWGGHPQGGRLTAQGLRRPHTWRPPTGPISEDSVSYIKL